MAGNYNDGSIFVDNFMTGFSFVDQIKRQKKADQRLEERLKQDKADRAYQRRRQDSADARVNTLFNQQQEDRVDSLEEERLREEGDAFALANPNATAEQLAPYLAHSPQAQALANQNNKRARTSDALQTAMGIGRGNQATQPQGGQSLSDAVAGQPVDNMEQLPTTSVEGTPTPAGFQESFTRAPNKGTSGLIALEESQFEPFDRRRQKQGAISQFGSTIAGDVTQAARGLADVVMSPFRGVEGALSDVGGAERESAPSAAKAEAFGTIYVPADEWTDETEMAALGSEEERAAAFARNEDVVDEYHDRGMNSKGGMTLGTTLGRTMEGSKLSLKDAENADRRAEKIFGDFVDPNIEGTLEQMAVKDPIAATQLYMEWRETGAGVMPGAIEEVDRRMVAVVEAAEQQLSQQAIEAPLGSPKSRIATNRLARLHESTNLVANRRPPIAVQAGVRGGSVNIGNQEVAQSVIEATWSPDNPSPTHIKPAALSSAATVAGRISPNKRLNSTQIEALATLAEAGWMDKNTAMSVMMTGQWPPGQDPNAIKETFKSGKTVWAVTNSGQRFVLDDPVGDRERKAKTGSGIDRSMSEDQMSWVAQGATMIGVPEERGYQVQNLLNEHAGWVRKYYNTDNQESMVAAGRALGQSVFLSAAKKKKMGDDWNPMTNPKNAPTPEEVFLNPDLRRELALEFKAQPVKMPAVGRRSNIDTDPFRQSLAEGVHGPALQAAVDGFDEDDLLYVYWVLNAQPDDIAAVNQGE
jgi:hypothetical protein